MDLREKRALNNGFGEALSRAFEFAVSPVIFGFLGHLLDMRLGTSPACLLLFAAFCVIGLFVKTWYAYDAEMKAQDAAGPWRKGQQQ
ncbi:MAG TPA: AtpZ/AtpI family protein [Acidimicrobiales bacterium]|nr:AtpZ/AtpI family protein [Acidimicrobiales bacterium]